MTIRPGFRLNNSHSSSVAKADNDFSRSVRGGQLHARHGNFTFYLIDCRYCGCFLRADHLNDRGKRYLLFALA